jgi:hypothetical protein
MRINAEHAEIAELSVPSGSRPRAEMPMDLLIADLRRLG